MLLLETTAWNSTAMGLHGKFVGSLASDPCGVDQVGTCEWLGQGRCGTGGWSHLVGHCHAVRGACRRVLLCPGQGTG